MSKKYLDYDGLLYFWQKIKTTFAMASHTHTKSEITDFPSTMTPSSHTHGNIQNGGTLQTTDVAIASGDKLVITDSSDSNKVARASLSFDGSTDTKALTKKGTWEDVLQFTGETDLTDGISIGVKYTNGSSFGTASIYDTARVNVLFSNATSQMSTALDGKVDKVTGKGLSTNDYTDAEKAKVGKLVFDGNDLIDSSILPSYVDDVIEAYARSGQTALSSTWLATGSASGTVITPETGKIYVLMADSGDYSANTQFRWSGTTYVKLADGGVSSITNAEIDTILAS